jgi:D-alanyl-D-alanine carboxypeptidase
MHEWSKNSRALLAAMVIVLLPSSCRSASGPPAAYQTVLVKAVAEGGVPGIQAYVRRGSAKWTGVAGVASVETLRRMTRSDRLRVASITKMLTYATVHELIKRGRLRLSDHAIDLLPAGTLAGIPNANAITIADLLEHKSGLHNFNGSSGNDFFVDLYSDPQRGTRRRTAAELLAYATKPENKPTGAPGEKTSYSSTGYIVLEMILEHREGKPLEELYRRYLFEPLGMRASGVEGADFGTEAIVDSYARKPDDPGPSPFGSRKTVRADGLVNLSAGLRYYNAWARGAGAVATNVDDLARFMDAVAAGRVIVLSDQEKQFAASRAKLGHLYDWNGGSWGIEATILYEPARDLTVIVLTNSSNVAASSHDVAKQLLAAARGAEETR